MLQRGPAEKTAAEYREVDVLGGGKQAATVNEDMLKVTKFKSLFQVNRNLFYN